MAKRKSTDKSSKSKAKDQVETDGVTDPQEPSDNTTSDMETAAEAVEAVEAYAPAEDAPPAEGDDTPADAPTDDTIELKEPDTDETPGADSDISNDSAEMAEPTETGDLADDHISEEEAERLIEEAETVGDHDQSNEAEPDAEPQADADSDTIKAESQEPVAPQVIRETTVERKGGFAPMVLGGVVAAALGYGVAAYVSQDVWPFAAANDTSFEDETRAALTAQDGSLSDLGARLSTLEGAEVPTVDLSPIETQLSTLESTTSELSSRLDALAGRIDTLERQPLEQAVSPEAIASYERALADLQAEVEKQRAEVAQMAEEAVAAEENAEEKAELAASRAALADIVTALDTGAGFSGAIAVLDGNGVTVPDALAANAETGLPTQAGLIESFPEAARAALSDARSADTEGAQGMGRVSTFFANQLGARSVAPKEGDDADAVLSRAEAAVRSGDLQTALTELSALPEIAQPAIADWQARAQTRLEAKTAADELVQQLLQE